MHLPLHKLFALGAILMLGSFALPSHGFAQTIQIDAVTANWIEGFSDFINWHESPNKESLKIGVIGAPEVANYLERRCSERNSKPKLQVVTLSADDSLEGIDIVFVAGSSRSKWAEIIQRCKTNKILSVGSQDGFIESGGCIEFVVRKNRLRFYIKQEHASKSGIAISSKLLELAIDPQK